MQMMVLNLELIKALNEETALVIALFIQTTIKARARLSNICSLCVTRRFM